jgi:hypothetical protein
VVLVRGFALIKEGTWNAAIGLFNEADYWRSFRGDGSNPSPHSLRAQNFKNVWDCNEPDAAINPIRDDMGNIINGEASIQSNAARLRLYLQAKAIEFKAQTGNYPAIINFVAHSMGGLILRCALNGQDHFAFEDQQGQSFSVKIGNVVMLATPNCGSVFADIVIGGIDPLVLAITQSLGIKDWASFRDLRLSYVVPTFNSSYHWPTSVPLFQMSATGGGYKKNTAPQYMITGGIIIDLNLALGFEESVNDGLVTQASVNGAYWSLKFAYPPLQRTVSVSMVQSVTDIQETGQYCDHSSVTENDTVFQWVTAQLTGTPFQPPTSTQASVVLRELAALSQSTPAQPQLLANINNVLNAGATAQVAVISDAASMLKFQLLVSAQNGKFSLIDPTGTVIDATSVQSNPNGQYAVNGGTTGAQLITYQISNPAVGTWQAIVDANGIAETQLGYNLTAFADSNVALIPQTAAQFSHGQDAVISCALADVGANPVVPVINAVITATVRLPDGTTTTLTLADDGLHNDGAPNDGVYGAVLPAVTQAGQYSITYNAAGQNSQGQALQRVASGAFNVSTADAEILGDPVFATVDTDGDGVADVLQAKCGVKSKVAGNYILSGQLADAGSTLHIPAAANYHVDGSGAMTVSLFFDLSLAKTAGMSGEFHIENLKLFEVPASGAVWVDTYQGTAVTQLSFGPSITAQAQNMTTISGGSASFTVGAAGNGVLTYQWQFSADGGTTWNNLGNSGTYAGVTTASLTLSGVSGAMNGYQFRAMVSDVTNSSTASYGVTLSVSKLTPVITWGAPSAISYGTALSATQLNATAGGVAGTSAYSPAAGAVLGAGGQNLSLTFTPIDTASYNTATGTQTLTVNKAALTAKADDKSKVQGTANPTLTISYTGFVNGDTKSAITEPAISTPATASSAAGTYPISLTGGAGANYILNLQNGTLTVVPSSYLANLSVRAAMAAGQTLIVGFVVDGGAKPMLVRAAGPVLNKYGLTGVVDPQLKLFNGSSTQVAANDNWDAALASTFTTLGAFPFDNGSKDAALQQTINGPHSAQTTATGAGAVLVEAYDAGPNDSRKLVNLSTRFQVGTGDNILIAGFVLSGTGTRQLLIRAVGPTLTNYGVTGVLADPQLSVFDVGTPIASNNDWSSSLSTTFTTLGAFALNAGSKDAALVVTLQAGKPYSVQVSGVGSTTGEALVEIYLMP